MTENTLRRSIRKWIVLTLLWAILSALGLGWLYEYARPLISPFLTPPPVTQSQRAPALEVVIQSTPPTTVNYGWAGPDVAQKALAELGDQVRVFDYEPTEWQAIEGRRVVLWPYVRGTNRGRDPPNIPQPVGDCVSRGWSHGCEHALATHIYLCGRGEFVRVYPPYIYGVSRVLIGGGRLGRGDGSTGAWAAKGVEQYGVLAWTDDCPAYTATNIREWGYRGPPTEYIARGKKHKAATKLVTDFASACVAISHGWPVPVCSNQGFSKIVEANGRIEGRPSGSWSHAMVFIGFDTREGYEAVYCLNSWGPNAHARCEHYAQLDAAPCGGFWVQKQVADRMLSQCDSYSVSFDGFTQSQSPVLRAFEVKGD